MSNITCAELFDIFYKIGGKINCNYEAINKTNKCKIKLLSQNIVCYLDKNESKELDKFVFIMSTNSNAILTNEYYEKFHHYQDPNSKSLTIDFNNSNKD